MSVNTKTVIFLALVYAIGATPVDSDLKQQKTLKNLLSVDEVPLQDARSNEKAELPRNKRQSPYRFPTFPRSTNFGFPRSPSFGFPRSPSFGFPRSPRFGFPNNAFPSFPNMEFPTLPNIDIPRVREFLAGDNFLQESRSLWNSGEIQRNYGGLLGYYSGLLGADFNQLTNGLKFYNNGEITLNCSRSNELIFLNYSPGYVLNGKLYGYNQKNVIHTNPDGRTITLCSGSCSRH